MIPAPAGNDYRPANWVASLRRFVGPVNAAVERCELCGSEIAGQHPHLLEPQTRRLLCACAACAVLFDSPEARQYRRVPRDAERLIDFRLSDAQWEAFMIPINMAFFFRSSTEDRVVALYPGPAGGTESMLDLAAWDDLADCNPRLRELEDDVEALLVNRVGGAQEYYRVPIDRCYELIGLIRRHWHGLSGGEGVREAIQGFFRTLRKEAGNGASAHA